jgi:hypothetical protein
MKILARIKTTLYPGADYSGNRTPAAAHKPKLKGSIYNLADLAKFAGASGDIYLPNPLTG